MHRMRFIGCLVVGISFVFALGGCDNNSVGKPKSGCGNDRKDYDELCDGTDLDGTTCTDLGLADGELACNSECKWDVSGCSGTQTCGNDVIEYPEECDGTNFGAVHCGSFGFGGGTLTCADCAIDTSSCTDPGVPYCAPAQPDTLNVDEGAAPVTATFLCSDAEGVPNLISSDVSAAPEGSVTVTSEEENGFLAVSITVSADKDDAGATGELDFEVSFVVDDSDTNQNEAVQPIHLTNPSPTFAPDPLPDLVATVGEAAQELVITFTDADGDDLSITPTLPPYASANITGTEVTVTVGPVSVEDDTGVPDAAQVVAVDSQQGSSNAAFSIEVNQVPTAEAGAALLVEPNQSVTLDGTGSSDPDEDALFYSWTPIGNAPPLDDPTLATPTFIAGGCNETYSYALVVSDGYADSPPDTVEVSVSDVGPFVSIKGCTPHDECGSLDKPWCTIQGGVVAAQLAGMDEVYVEEGRYVQNNTNAQVPETLAFVHDAEGDPAILGGYNDLSTMSRADTASCNLDIEGNGATVVEVSEAEGIVFGSGTLHLFERFCVKRSGFTSVSGRKAKITIRNGSATIRGNIIDGSEGVGMDETIGIDIRATGDAVVHMAPVVEGNFDDPQAGIFFAGDGSTATGIAVKGMVELLISGNTIHGGSNSVGWAAVRTGSANELPPASGSISLSGNQLIGGKAEATSWGVYAEGAKSLPLALTLEDNHIVGGVAQKTAAVSAQGLASLRITNGNVLIGSEQGKSNQAYGVIAEASTGVTISGNEMLVGGPASGDEYRAVGVLLRDLSDFSITDNGLIQGCRPACGPGDHTAENMPAGGAGILIEGGVGGSANTITTNQQIVGGPAIGGEKRIESRSIGIDIRGAQVGDDRLLSIDIRQNNTIIGNDVLQLLDPIEVDSRPEYAYGIRIANAVVGISENQIISGGRAVVDATGVRVMRYLHPFASVSLTDNGSVVGAPYEDGIERRPAAACGVWFHGSAESGPMVASSLLAHGSAARWQEIGGGFARAAVAGLDVESIDTLDLWRNRIFGGAAPEGTSQIGARVTGVVGSPDGAQLEGIDANLIEACGLVDPTGALHHPECDALSSRSIGLLISDGVGQPTSVSNSLVFGGFSRAGSSAIVVVDSGVSRAKPKVFNNYFNAQGPWAVVCESALLSSAHAIHLLPPSTSIGGPGGEGLEFHNNIIDAGGRACLRYGVYEDSSLSVDGYTYDHAQFTHNVWVQSLPERDNPIDTALTWGYFENMGLSAPRLWCRAGSPDPDEHIDPEHCLNYNLGSDPTAPSFEENFLQNREGDPEFAGSDVAISEVPGTLPLADFHATAEILQQNGSQAVLPAPLPTDYEGDSRSDDICDVGHDETL